MAVILNDTGNSMKLGIKIAAGIVAVLLVIGLLGRALPVFTVSYGMVGVVTRFGSIARIAQPGLNVKTPVIEDVEYFRTQKVIYETSEQAGKSNADYTDEPVDSSTADGQQVSVRYTVRFRLPPDKIKAIAETIGFESQVVERVVKTESRSVVRNVAREFKAEQLYTGDVFKFQQKVTELLKTSFDKNGIELDEFLVRQIKFGDEYVKAVEQKQIEYERVKAEEYKADQEKFRKAQTITKAEGDAKAQEILRANLTDQVLQKLFIEKWNGILPTYMGNGLQTFLNLNK